MHIFTQSENVIAVNSNIQPCIKNFETIIVTMSCVTFKIVQSTFTCGRLFSLSLFHTNPNSLQAWLILTEVKKSM